MSESELWYESVPEVFRDWPEFAFVEDLPDLPGVLLLGDSISMSYTRPVRQRLEGIANVHRVPDNGRSTRFVLAEFERFLGEKPWKIIHFNCGIHDITQFDEDGEVVEEGAVGAQQVPLAEYKANLAALVGRLRTTKAILIWASTTPVQEGTRARSSADVVRYNQAAATVMADRGILVNDLYALALPRMTALQPPLNVHFTEAGAAVLGEWVAAVIREQLD
jgi:acyl-CoA thioesterase-1